MEDRCGSGFRGFELGLLISTEVETAIEIWACPGTRKQQPRRKIRIEEERDPRLMRCCRILRSMLARLPIGIVFGMIRVEEPLDRVLGARLRFR
jgi:hypothetical protein